MNSIIKKAYDISPVFVQNIMISLYGRKLYRERYSNVYYEHLDFLRNNFNKIDHYSYQKEMLNNFLNHVVKNSIYYNKRINKNFLPIKKLNDLENMPIIDKEVLRENIDSIITNPRKSLIPSFTGGTTGKSLNIFFTHADMEKRMAFLDYFKERHGVKKGMKRASFTGKSLVPLRQKKNVYWRYNSPLKQMLFSSFHLTEKNIPYYIQALNNFKPQSMDGFPSVMLTIARYIVQNQIKLSFKPIAIFPTAEMISDNDREILEKAFSAPVRNQYASSEGAPFITECPNGNLHLDIMTGVFEKVDKGSSISEILVTAFETTGTPLVRYKIGDTLEFTDRKCTCGYDTPLVNRILGRNMDFLYSKDRGKISSANMSNTIKGLPNSVKKIQFVQSGTENITIRIVRDEKKFTHLHEEEILKEMAVRLGESIYLKIDYVEDIQVEKSGKYRMVKNHIKDLNQ